MDTATQARQMSFLRLMVGTASLALIVIALKMASTYLSPILLAFFLAILISPVLHWLQNRKLSAGLVLTVIIVGFIVFVLGLVWFIGVSFRRLAESLSVYQAQIREWFAAAQSALADQGVSVSERELGARDDDSH
jgi:AI-2 transport protein TqsA